MKPLHHLATMRCAKGLVAASVLSLAAAAHAGDACITLPGSVSADTLKALSRGVNLAGWMDAPGSPTPTALLRTLRKAGMTHVRLPVPAEKLMRRFASEQEVNRQLRGVDQALSRLMSLGYTISVDLHPGDEFN